MRRKMLLEAMLPVAIENEYFYPLKDLHGSIYTWYIIERRVRKGKDQQSMTSPYRQQCHTYFSGQSQCCLEKQRVDR